MEPSIQYAQTADGVSIAFWTLGEGPPIVCMPPVPFSHIQAEWYIPDWRGWYERLGRNRKLIRYDGRGTGLSDRDATDFSLEAQILDLEAVLDRLALERFVLFAQFYAGPVAITYAARHPYRVSHLLLWHTFARAPDYVQMPQTQAIIGLLTQDWELFTETFAHARMGWSKGEQARRFAAFVRECVTHETAQVAMQTIQEYDVSDILPDVKSPTLVLHRREFPASHPSAPRDLASGISDARLALLEGDAGAPYAPDPEPVVRAIDEFLGEGAPPPAEPASPGTAQPLSEPLSARELEVLRLIDSGMSNQQIADELVVALGTVKTHINNIYGKLQVRSRTQALARARELNLLV